VPSVVGLAETGDVHFASLAIDDRGGWHATIGRSGGRGDSENFQAVDLEIWPQFIPKSSAVRMAPSGTFPEADAGEAAAASMCLSTTARRLSAVRSHSAGNPRPLVARQIT